MPGRGQKENTGDERGPTMVDVAKACGVTQSTVSRALHNHPAIPVATREKILRRARELGFRPDAKLAELMARVRHGRRLARQATLALVHLPDDVPGSQRWPGRISYAMGVRQRAVALGYGVDELTCEDEPRGGRQLMQVLRARRIEGVVLLPAKRLPDCDWAAAAWACLGFFSEQPLLHAAASDYVFHAMECFDRLAGRGCRRIGLIQTQATDIELGHEWLAGYTAAAFRHGQSPLVFTSPDRLLTGLPRWLAATKPDGLVTSSFQTAPFVAALPHPPPVVFLNLASAHEGRTGIVERRTEVGMSAVDLVVGQLHRGERGVPAYCKHVLVRGVWAEG